MINAECNQPRYCELEKGRKAHPAPAIGFLADSRQRRGAGNIKQAKYHKAKGVERAEAYALQCGRKRRHAFGRAGVDYSKKYRAARYHHFFGGYSSYKRHGYLPEAKPYRRKKWSKPSAYNRPEAAVISSAKPCGPKLSSAQIIMVARKMVVPAFPK